MTLARFRAAFIHPLAALAREQLISALVQKVNVTPTYGDLFEELRKKGEVLCHPLLWVRKIAPPLVSNLT
jgi:hypothetical protein